MKDFRKFVGDRACRLSSAQEQAIGEEILAAESEVRRLAQAYPDSLAVLRRAATARERTRAGKVDRLGEAVDVLEKRAGADPTCRDDARAARAAWSRAHELRWRLALSARHVAVHEARKIGDSYLSEEDLVSEGFIGLLRAAKRFEPDREVRFTTYARWWARAQMTRAIDLGGRPVRLTGCAVEQLRAVARARDELDDGTGDPTHAELAAAAGVSEERLRVLLGGPHVVSLDAPLDASPEAGSRHDLLEDDALEAPDDALGRTEEVIALREALAALPSERLRHVLSLRYGLADGEPRTLAAVGELLGLSRERVRQLEARAFALLRVALAGETSAEAA